MQTSPLSFGLATPRANRAISGVQYNVASAARPTADSFHKASSASGARFSGALSALLPGGFKTIKAAVLLSGPPTAFFATGGALSSLGVAGGLTAAAPILGAFWFLSSAAVLVPPILKRFIV